MAQQTFTYTVVYERDPESGEICASVPALDLATHGPTLADARAMMREALELHLEGMADENMPIPPDVIQVEQIAVEVPTPAPEEAAS
jgi:predicted RNase H-like HicB family nuclease